MIHREPENLEVQWISSAYTARGDFEKVGFLVYRYPDVWSLSI